MFNFRGPIKRAVVLAYTASFILLLNEPEGWRILCVCTFWGWSWIVE